MLRCRVNDHYVAAEGNFLVCDSMPKASGHDRRLSAPKQPMAKSI